MNALILVAGKASRFGRLCDGMPKCLLPIGGKSLLQCNLDLLRGIPISRVCIVTSRKFLEPIRRDVRSRRQRFPVRFVVQSKRLGTGHAVLTAQREMGGESFIYLVGDNFTDFDLRLLLRRHRRTGASATLALKKVADPSRYGVAEIKGHHIVHLWEKCAAPPSDLSFTSMAVFTPDIFPALRRTKKNPEQREYFLTDAVSRLIEDGHRVAYVTVHTVRININTPADYEQAQRAAQSR